jgi:hypothetical protein
LRSGLSARRIVGLQGLALIVAVVALAAARPGQPAPGITGGPWINSPALTAAALRGRVVFVEFLTYGWINCRNVIPQLRAWRERYEREGLTIAYAETEPVIRRLLAEPRPG